ncbi:unnamed protein product [Ostreobium quekettii]|uniref:Protein kinase domain-containing protein n=1 Tax=Ostreobium quekettii TaxID=121088 RepID=A0A8S1J8J0_9CHLO|nr:unnamed protein product [Ostreobium quekettii]
MSRSSRGDGRSPGGTSRSAEPPGPDLDLSPQRGPPIADQGAFPGLGEQGGMPAVFGGLWTRTSGGEEGGSGAQGSGAHRGDAGKAEWERAANTSAEAGHAGRRTSSTFERRRRKRIPTLLRKRSSTEPGSPCRPHRPSFRVQPIHDEATFVSCELNGPFRPRSTSPSGGFFDHNWSESTSPSTSCTGVVQGTAFSGPVEGATGAEDHMLRVDSLGMSQEVADTAAQVAMGKEGPADPKKPSHLVIDTSKKHPSPFMVLDEREDAGALVAASKSTDCGGMGSAGFSFPVTPQSEEIVSFVSVDTQASIPFNSLTIEDGHFSPFLSIDSHTQASGWNSPDGAEGQNGHRPSAEVARTDEAGAHESVREPSEMEYSPGNYPETAQQFGRGNVVDDSWEVINLKVYHKKGATGFEMSKNLQVRRGDIVAGRYRVINELDTAAFSYAVSAEDLKSGNYVCLKIIKNNKDYFDQSLDEIKLLRMINTHDPNDEAGIVRMYDFFYYKEHLIIVFELLNNNLYAMHRRSIRDGLPTYFTLQNIQSIARQILRATAFLHSLNIIHADLKPENVLMQMLEPCRVKIIDLGSSCFTTDHLGSYIQSRAYRAPEVILGLPYCEKIDVWSIGCIVAEMATGYALFQSDYAGGVLACIESLLGPLPALMQAEGKYSSNYYTRSGRIYHQNPSTQQYEVLQPLQTDLRSCLETDDQLFLDFLSFLLVVDPSERPSPEDALSHPWLQAEVGGPPQMSSGF